MKIENPAVKRLLEENGDFRKLYAEHLRYEEELAELDRHHYLTPEQDRQRKTIQKLKLAGKDRMMAMVRSAGGDLG